MVWLLRSKMLRKPITLVGAACTSVLVGVIVFDKLLQSSSKTLPTCIASCSASSSAAYTRLKKNEASQMIKNHPVVSGFDVNFLGSNSPIEDRFVIGTSANLGAAFFSMIDGHKGGHCSSHLQRTMLQYISAELHEAMNNARAVGGKIAKDDLEVLLDMNRTRQQHLTFPFQDRNLKVEAGEAAPGSKVTTLPDNIIKECLRQAFITLDNDICNSGLKDVKAILRGRSFTSEMKERVMTAIDGACAITALVQESGIFVANTGDCRVVLGQKLSNGSWKPIPLSIDQNSHNEEEVNRIYQLHPGEMKTVIIGNRVLGSLMPFRTFGDVDFKWEKKYLESLVQVWPNYLTPPYITAEPVVTLHSMSTEDKGMQDSSRSGDESSKGNFMILASDGLWERMSNEDAVKIVGDLIKGAQKPAKQSFLGSIFGRTKTDHDQIETDECCVENAATKLLWNALGGTESSVQELLDVDPNWSRMYRDDISIIVVFFK